MISQNFITKIEGHGSLKIDWAKKKVKLRVHEGERLFEGMLRGRASEEVHWITPRICGVCPIAHNLASLKAVEDALDIRPNQTTVFLRRLMEAAQIVQSHILHLYFLALPDYVGLDKGVELAEKFPKLFQSALNLKRISDEIAYVTAGRNVHPTTTTVGGFHKIPTKIQLKNLLAESQKGLKDAMATADLFVSLKYPQIKIDLELIAQNSSQEKYPIYDVIEVKSNRRGRFLIKNYKKNIEEEVREHSTAKFGQYRQKEFMVGALARLALNGAGLRPRAKEFLSKHRIDFNNPFHNNLAQAVEVLHFIEETIGLLEDLIKKPLSDRVVKPKIKSGQGIGAVEAPRGGLYHEIHLNQKGAVSFANIITPTVQNLTSIEKSAQAILSQARHQNEQKIKKLMEMLVRAYDPCITCSVH